MLPTSQSQASTKKPLHASWKEWDSKSYLQTYFQKPGPDTYVNLRFLIRELSTFHPKRNLKVLDFGSGPTIFGGIVSVPYAREIHIADYLQNNLEEINKWINGTTDAFDWTPYIQIALELEGKPFDIANAAERAKFLRTKITRLLKCDASKDEPLGSAALYPIVMTNFCADSATSSKETWAMYMHNIINLVLPSGLFLVAALHRCKAYKVGDFLFPSANINENDMRNILIKEGFRKQDILLEVQEVPQCASEGFTSIMHARAIKSPLTRKIMYTKEY